MISHYIIRMKNVIMQQNVTMLCKNAAEVKRKFTLFRNLRKNSLPLQFAKIKHNLTQFVLQSINCHRQTEQSILIQPVLVLQLPYG